jgi:Tfp pilus assembly protein PilO
MAEAKVEAATSKRSKISKAQQLTMLEVLIASLVFGACAVLSIFLIKYINFNTKIISAKSQAITDYDQSLRNVGVCVDTDKNGRLSNEELENCNSNEVSLNSVTNSLRYKVLMQMAQNTDLESVARQRNEKCYDDKGEKIDFNEKYEKTTDELEKQQYLQMSKVCSALRVIPDALPAQKNTEALMASLNQVLLLTGWEPERLTPRDDAVESRIEGIGVIPVTLQVEGGTDVVLRALNNIERSVREFDITSGTIEWTNSGLSLNALADAYYLEDAAEIEKTVVIKASDKTRRK